MSRRKIITPATFIRRQGTNRRVTDSAVGRLHDQMRQDGYVTSSSAREDSRRARVWVRGDDIRASLMRAAVVEDVVAIDSVSRILGLTRIKKLPHGELSRLGIVAVPVDDQHIRLVGTSPSAARIANHVHWGLRRRTITPNELLVATMGCTPGSKPSVTDRRLEEALMFFFDRFGIDFSDVVYRNPILI